jgi:hypothetical protein
VPLGAQYQVLGPLSEIYRGSLAGVLADAAYNIEGLAVVVWILGDGACLFEIFGKQSTRGKIRHEEALAREDYCARRQDRR